VSAVTHLRPTTTWDAAWAAALDRMELDAAQVETMLVRLHAEADHVPDLPVLWSPPERLGPLPASLAVRAQAVLERHQRMATALTSAMVENARQRRATAALNDVTARRAEPVYVDTAV
jgi:hypothetical protein